MYVCMCVCSCRRAHACILLSYATVCTSIQVAGLASLSANQVEPLNQDPAMHVDILLCANEAGYNGGVGASEGEKQPIRR